MRADGGTWLGELFQAEALGLGQRRDRDEPEMSSQGDPP